VDLVTETDARAVARARVARALRITPRAAPISRRSIARRSRRSTVEGSIFAIDPRRVDRRVDRAIDRASIAAPSLSKTPISTTRDARDAAHTDAARRATTSNERRAEESRARWRRRTRARRD